LFNTGSVPGIPAHTGQTLTFGSAFVVSTLGQEQNILLAVASSAWTSSPMTGSYFMMGLILSQWVSVQYLSLNLFGNNHQFSRNDPTMKRVNRLLSFSCPTEYREYDY
jgi:hypothetical protein